METAQEKLEAIFKLLYGKDDTKEAIAYGITKDKDNNLISKIITKGDDIYEMIDTLHEDKTYLVNDFVSVRTTGWAAPLGANGEVEGAPSQHPKRRRVRLMSIVTRSYEVASALGFADDDEIVTDSGTARGSLAEALLHTMKQIVSKSN